MDPRTAWNRGAPIWDEFVKGGLDYFRTEVHGPALLTACGDVRGLRVLDIGCGQGWFSRRLAERGADVIGVDVAEEVIANARRHETDWGSRGRHPGRSSACWLWRAALACRCS